MTAPTLARALDRLRATAQREAHAKMAALIEGRRITDQVDKARKEGASWADIGQAIGVSRQAAQQRFGL